VSVAKHYPLYTVVVEVTTRDETKHCEDWPPDEAAEAHEYARETATCSDVLSTTYRNSLTGEERTYPAPSTAIAAEFFCDGEPYGRERCDSQCRACAAAEAPESDGGVEGLKR
jgi:hypothetical protein